MKIFQNCYFSLLFRTYFRKIRQLLGAPWAMLNVNVWIEDSFGQNLARNSKNLAKIATFLLKIKNSKIRKFSLWILIFHWLLKFFEAFSSSRDRAPDPTRLPPYKPVHGGPWSPKNSCGRFLAHFTPMKNIKSL